uniref:Capsid protein n=1 Tax=unidentified TaxID=32644 RepID=A0A6G9W0S9_9ZZZZ|nr:capsid protein [unidentified]
MYRRRMCRRTFRRPKRNYQIVRPGYNITLYGTPTGEQVNYTTVVNPADVTGVRKVKNFQVSFNVDQGQPSFWWALVYVPKGYVPNQIYPTGASNDLYSPSNNVLVCGFYDSSDPTRQTWFSRLSRNLNAGDGLALVYKPVTQSRDGEAQVMLQYAITF